MYSQDILGYSVKLPVKPYPAQIKTMETILACLERSESGMVESPTGTGKSFSILAAVSAWIQRMKTTQTSGPDGSTEVVKVYICSRTHQQISQLIEQLKKIPNPPSMSVLGSRKHMCLNQTVLRDNKLDLDSGCKNQRNNAGCTFYDNKDKVESLNVGVFNIEDVSKYGRKESACPYYGVRKLTERASLVFAPYNYIINPLIRKALSINLESSALIIDEGHNIEDACRDAASMELTIPLCNMVQRKAAEGIAELATGCDDRRDELIGDFSAIKNIADTLITYMEAKAEEIRMLSQNQSGFNQEVEIAIAEQEMVAEMGKMGLCPEAVARLVDAYTSLSQRDLLGPREGQVLSQIVFVAQNMLTPGETRYAIITAADKLLFSCLHAEVLFRPIEKMARCVVLLSGTLTPFEPICTELTSFEPVFKHQVLAPHVIGKNQLFPVCITGNGREKFIGTYKGQTPTYFMEIGKIITEISKSLGRIGGVLVFAPSYSSIDKLAKQIGEVTVYRESTDMGMFEKQLSLYKKNSRQGFCVFLCVFRGKASEGVDFRDHESRAVVVVGIPYLSITCKSNMLKKEYNNQYLRKSGQTWYEQQAYKAVNQGVGRCIRHKEDWGSIFWLDSRYSFTSHRKMLSGWASESMQVLSSWNEAKPKFTAFLKQHVSGVEVETNRENLPNGPDQGAGVKRRPGNLTRYFH
ncbi:fanconi anemia group J protein [Nematocida homosporus]|uniref:fanconi anemia group J protein n=1 Tax=Nematocida homosporus TaxID=1912981 RepID=UPI00221E5B85|nr:fanconi anemia group J protein [Nematocida homosporus]KAI5187329.1 fanconi anemia group J protein [Nematocida homosporus]